MAPSRYERFLEPEREPEPRRPEERRPEHQPEQSPHPLQPPPVPRPLTTPAEEQKKALIFLAVGVVALLLCIMAYIKAVYAKADLFEEMSIVWVMVVSLASAIVTGFMVYRAPRLEQTTLKVPAMAVCGAACIFAIAVFHLALIEAAKPNTANALKLMRTLTERLKKLAEENDFSAGTELLHRAMSDRDDLLWKYGGFTRHGYDFEIHADKENRRRFFLLAEPNNIIGLAPAFIANEEGEIRYGVPGRRELWGVDYKRLSEIFARYKPLAGRSANAEQ